MPPSGWHGRGNCINHVASGSVQKIIDCFFAKFAFYIVLVYNHEQERKKKLLFAKGGRGVFCENCGMELAEEDSFCTNCGTPVVKEEAGGFSENVPGGFPGNSPKPGGHKKKVLLSVLAAAAGVAVVAVVAVFGMNFFRRTFSSPEKYFRYTTEKYMKEQAGTIASGYDRLIRENYNVSNKSINAELTVRLGDGGRDFLESAAAYADLEEFEDLGWLEQVSVETEFSVKDKVMSGNLALKLGEDELLSGNGIADMGDETAYFQVPALSDKYIGVDLDEVIEELAYYMEDGDIIAYFDNLYACCPDKEAVEKLLYQYGTLAVSCIDEVEKSKETISAGNVSQKCTALQTVIRSKTLQNMTKTVLREMKEDEELRQIMKNLSKIEGAEDLYDEYRDLLSEADDLADDIDLSDKIVLTTYVNNKSEIIGVEMKAGDVRLYYAVLRKGKDIGCEVVCDIDDEGFRLEGNGTVSGSKVNMDFELRIETYYGTERVEFQVEDFDAAAAAQGNLKGSIILPLEELEDLLDLNGQIPGDYILEVSFDTGGQSGNVDIRLLEDKEEIVSVGLRKETGSAKSIEIPKNRDVIMVEDVYDLEDWLDTIDADQLIKNLKNAGIPRDITDEIEDFVDVFLWRPMWGTSTPAEEAAAEEFDW